MKPLLINPINWTDYSLIDSGDGRKLEKFGPYTFSRPEPQAIWSPRLKAEVWENSSGSFLTSSSLDNEDTKGKWVIKNNIPNKWEMSFDKLKFFVTPTPFRHLGFFPDQSPHWVWAAKKISEFKSISNQTNYPKVLNLFGYSGLASLHAAINGAAVTHVDASKKAINFAFENRNLSSLQELPIKFITEDVVKFVNREIRRGNKYDGIILDPPKYGRGPNGERWELFRDLPLLLKCVPQILSNNPIFIILNSYAIRSSHISLHYGLSEVMKNYSGMVESGEISIVEDQVNPRQISTAIFARWEKRLII